ncbi:MAG TPA: hypothetical protein VLX28_09965 [Thermoanaerobaculia bacterium]|nr:hypothetical protein [Thermoanaerobaculia bacterium]
MSDLAAPVRYQDRSTGLILVGILEIVLGLLCLVLLAFMGIAAVSIGRMPAGQAAAMNSRLMVVYCGFYLLIALFFGLTGVGTLRGRRWARTIMLVVSWSWLLSGVFGTVLMIFILPKMTDAVSASAARGGPAADSGAGALIMGCVAIFVVLLYIALPGILLLFYRGPNVRATFEAKDPSIPWTDRVPAPVLALTLLFGVGALGGLIGTTYGVFPVFGFMLTGLPAVLGFLVLGAIAAVLAWAIYRQRPAAWWGVLAWTVLGSVHSFFFFKNGGASLRRMYEAMGTPAVQLEQLEKMGIYDLWSHPVVLALLVLGWLGWLGFLIWAKRFFTLER